MYALRRAPLAVALLCVAGCSTSDHASSTSLVFDDRSYAQFASQHPEIESAPDLDLTYVLVGSFGPDELALRQQTASLRSRCLRLSGFDVPTDQPTVDDVSWDGFSIMPKLDQRFTTSSGYGIVTGQRPNTTTAAPSALDGYVATLNDAERERFGQADSACLSQIEDELFDDFERWEALRAELEQLRNDFALALQGSPPIIELEQAWSECMADSGYSFSRPTAILEVLYQRHNVNDLNLEEEIQTATADLSCRTSVNFEETYWRLYQTAEIKLVEDNYQLIQDVRQAKYGRILRRETSTASTALGS